MTYSLQDLPTGTEMLFGTVTNWLPGAVEAIIESCNPSVFVTIPRENLEQADLIGTKSALVIYRIPRGADTYRLVARPIPSLTADKAKALDEEIAGVRPDEFQWE